MKKSSRLEHDPVTLVIEATERAIFINMKVELKRDNKINKDSKIV